MPRPVGLGGGLLAGDELDQHGGVGALGGRASRAGRAARGAPAAISSRRLIPASRGTGRATGVPNASLSSAVSRGRARRPCRRRARRSSRPREARQRHHVGDDRGLARAPPPPAASTRSAAGCGASCGRPPSAATAAASLRGALAALADTSRTVPRPRRRAPRQLAGGGHQRALGRELAQHRVGRRGDDLLLLPAPRQQRDRAAGEQRPPGHHQTVESRFSISSTGSV